MYIYTYTHIYKLTGKAVCVIHVCSDEEIEGVGGDGHTEGLIRELYIYICI